jgi:Ankyrin repeat
MRISFWPRVIIILVLFAAGAIALFTNPFDLGLDAAVRRGDLRAAEGVVGWWNVNQSDRWGWTPLMSAAVAGDEDMTRLLLANGADRGKRDKKFHRSALDHVNSRLG